MSEFEISAEERKQLGKNANRRLRSEGRIPAVVYGRGFGNMPVSVDPEDVIEVLMSESGRNTIFTLKISDQETNALVRDFQLHPIKGTLLHADFQRIAMDQLMEFEIPIETEGRPKGFADGGILDVVLREIRVECLPTEVPDHLTINVEALEIGDALRVSDLEIDTEKLKVLTEEDRVLVTVTPPMEEEEEELEEAEELLEPELIGEEAEEEEGEEPEETESAQR